jgi:hypothetical protein
MASNFDISSVLVAVSGKNETFDATLEHASFSKNLPVDEVLLTWANGHLADITVGGRPYLRRMENFRSDLKDGEILVLLFSHLLPENVPRELVEEIDVHERVNKFVDVIGRIEGLDCSWLVDDHILEENEVANMSLISQLFMLKPGWDSTDASYRNKILHLLNVGPKKLDTIKTQWKHVSDSCLVSQKLQSGGLKDQCFWEDEQTVLLKNIPSLVITMNTLVNACAMASKQSDGATTCWRSLMARCSSHTWSAFIGNGGLDKKIDTVDLNKRRLVASFTSIDPIQVQDAVAEVINSSGGVGLTPSEIENQFKRIGKILTKNVSVLRSVFRCYCVKDGENALRMSQGGFTSFLQDIEVLEKTKVDGDDVFRVPPWILCPTLFL